MPSLPDSSPQTFFLITCAFSSNLYHYLNLLHSDFWLSAIPLYFSKKFKEVLSGFLVSTYVSAPFGFTLLYLNLAFRNHDIGGWVHTMVLWCRAQWGSRDHIFFPLPKQRGQQPRKLLITGQTSGLVNLMRGYTSRLHHLHSFSIIIHFCMATK